MTAGESGFTPDELELITNEGVLSEGDKNEPPPAGDRHTVSVTDEQHVVGRGHTGQDPIAEGVTEDRAERWAVFDKRRGAYIESTVRTRPPTDRMRAEYAGDRFEWYRV